MNNNNFIGSAMLVLHLDVNTRPIPMGEEDGNFDFLKIALLNSKKGEKKVKKVLRRQISYVEKTVLPDIK